MFNFVKNKYLFLCNLYIFFQLNLSIDTPRNFILAILSIHKSLLSYKIFLLYFEKLYTYLIL